MTSLASHGWWDVRVRGFHKAGNYDPLTVHTTINFHVVDKHVEACKVLICKTFRTELSGTIVTLRHFFENPSPGQGWATIPQGKLA